MNKLSYKHSALIFSIFLFLALIATYYNHFNNSFHFDDSHTIENNSFIRDIRNIPSFFKDARTFSSLPSNQSYRPIISTSLAIDYWLGGTLEPFYFHLSTFIWFIIQLVLMYFFYLKLFPTQTAFKKQTALALFAVAWYGLHPVSAETINYVIQRGDLYSTLGVIAAFVIYFYAPRKRKYGLYLLPVVLGSLAKPPAIMFAPLLFFYVLLFEEKSSLCFWNNGFYWQKIWKSLLASMPSFIVCFALYYLQDKMTSSTYSPGGASLYNYLITQPLVHLEYIRSLFIPTGLCADSDWEPLTKFLSVPVLLPLTAIISIFALIFYCSNKENLRSISFGLLWFFIALFPTTITPLSEVINTHRMFFPFVGLILSICSVTMLLLQMLTRQHKTLAHIVTTAAICTLPFYAYATTLRNQVWQTEESLWADNAIKAPKNGRGLMNYGLTLMGRGENEKALEYFERAKIFLPRYPTLYINLGIVEGQLQRNSEAEAYFNEAIRLDPNLARPYFFYARWLNKQNRNNQAIANLKISVAKVPEFFESRYLLMQIYLELKEWAQLRAIAADSLKLNPNDVETLEFLRKTISSENEEIKAAEELVKNRPNAKDLLDLSFVYYRSGRFEDCITIAKTAIQMKPNYADAYNNIGSAYNALSNYAEAIKALEEALKIDPGNQLAKNNLTWAKTR